MAIVDAIYRFIWTSCGYSGNIHDLLICKSIKLCSDITDGRVIPNIAKPEVEAKIHPLIEGDAAFPFTNKANATIQKYNSVIRTEIFQISTEQGKNRDKRSIWQAQGALGGIDEKRMSKKKTIQTMTPVCIVLHNICTQLEDAVPNC